MNTNENKGLIWNLLQSHGHFNKVDNTKFNEIKFVVLIILFIIVVFELFYLNFLIVHSLIYDLYETYYFQLDYHLCSLSFV